MKRILYLECNFGISGDMFVGAMLDLGVDEDAVKKTIEKLGLTGFELNITFPKISGIKVCDFDVVVDKEHENHDHDMEYLFGHITGINNKSQEENTITKEVENENKQREIKTEKQHGIGTRHVKMSDIRGLFERVDIDEKVKNRALDIFTVLAEAEAEAHGVDVEDVHFHEVGALDSIVDIVAAAVCIEEIGADEVIVSPLAEGTGTIRTRHGILPVPVPAVLAIAKKHELVFSNNNLNGEFVTPTGAAIAASIRTGKKLPKNYRIVKSGLGGGKRKYEPQSMLRAMIIEEINSASDEIIKLETDIDDTTPEALGYAMDKLYEVGAKEVHFVPVYMKKNRPGVTLVVITDDEHLPDIERCIFEETTTIGIRKQRMERSVLDREEVLAETEYGDVKVKRVTLPDGSKRDYPEYDDLKRISMEKGVPLVEVRAQVMKNVQ
ncbi:MAG: nickel pincer cofactor biosynthesis protein LarC [Eubacterium sp.]|nr:nickel pincer cofactor biosynthesis protein LarC [Eubacterium sp.]